MSGSWTRDLGLWQPTPHGITIGRKTEGRLRRGCPLPATTHVTSDMKIRDIMTKDVITVAPDTPVKEVIEQMVHSQVSGVPVVDSSGRLLGIVTEADVITKEAYGGRRPRALALLVDTLAGRDHHWVVKAAGLTAAEVMSEHPVMCEPGDEVATVARRMLERGVKRMPVVEDGSVEGMISRGHPGHVRSV